LDGHGFSTFLRPFRKPDDERVSKAMIETTADLVSNFSPSLGFTCSDEITLIFPFEAKKDDDPTNPKPKELPFKGRVQKLSTLMASFASVSFYQHILEQPLEESLVTYVKRKEPHFDGRAFNVPGNYELVNNVLWRTFDYRRNSIACLAFKYFNNKSLHKMNGKQMREKLVAEKGVHWEEMPNWYKFGVFVKRELYQKETTNPQSGEKAVATRTRIVNHSIELQSVYTVENEKFILSRYFEGLPKVVEVVHKEKQENQPKLNKDGIESDKMKVTRFYADEEGNSKFEDIYIPLTKTTIYGTLSEPYPAKNVVFRYTSPSYDDKHCAPKRQYIVLLEGGVDITVTDGTKRSFKPGDILLAEDTTGKGHHSKAINQQARRSVFIELE